MRVRTSLIASVGLRKKFKDCRDHGPRSNNQWKSARARNAPWESSRFGFADGGNPSFYAAPGELAEVVANLKPENVRSHLHACRAHRPPITSARLAPMLASIMGGPR